MVAIQPTGQYYRIFRCTSPPFKSQNHSKKSTSTSTRTKTLTVIQRVEKITLDIELVYLYWANRVNRVFQVVLFESKMIVYLH